MIFLDDESSPITNAGVKFTMHWLLSSLGGVFLLLLTAYYFSCEHKLGLLPVLRQRKSYSSI